MSTQICSNCLYGTVDPLDRIYCAKFGSTSNRSHTCGLWKSIEQNLLEEQNRPGYVYILSNPDLDGLLKVGMTSKSPEERTKQLSNLTGISSKYEIEYYGKVADRVIAENAAHNRLRNFRHNKEFFKVDVDVAIYCVETISSAIERAYIRPGNARKVLDYARRRDQIPYKQVEKEWRARNKELNDYKAQIGKTKDWEAMVEGYMRKKTGNDTTLFDYKKMPGNPNARNEKRTSIKEEYDSNKVVLPSELAKAEQETKKAHDELESKKREIKKKELEMQQLKLELLEEKNKGFFKRIFS